MFTSLLLLPFWNVEQMLELCQANVSVIPGVFLFLMDRVQF